MSTPRRASTKATPPKPAAHAAEETAKKVVGTVARKAAPAPTPSTPSTPRPTSKRPATSRPVAFPARDVERPYGFPPETPELPAVYGENRFVLMTKDPETLFAYWEITPALKNECEKGMRRGENYQEALRLNWPARDIFDNNFVVFPVAFTARKWYVRVPFPGLSYHAEIGWLGGNGHFVPLMTSNPSDAPESWDATRRRLKDTVAGRALLERAARHGAPHGSSDLAQAGAPTSSDDDFQGPGALNSSSGMAGPVHNAKPARKPVRPAAE